MSGLSASTFSRSGDAWRFGFGVDACEDDIAGGVERRDGASLRSSRSRSSSSVGGGDERGDERGDDEALMVIDGRHRARKRRGLRHKRCTCGGKALVWEIAENTETSR
jgi:hypothetical protein